MTDSFNPKFPTELDDNFIPTRQEIQRILREEECLVEGSDGYSRGFNLCEEFYLKVDVDAVLAEKDAEIRKLRRALYKACANWADVVAFEETEGIGYDNSVAERWRKMESKCREKAERYK